MTPELARDIGSSSEPWTSHAEPHLAASRLEYVEWVACLWLRGILVAVFITSSVLMVIGMILARGVPHIFQVEGGLLLSLLVAILGAVTASEGVGMTWRVTVPAVGLSAFGIALVALGSFS